MGAGIDPTQISGEGVQFVGFVPRTRIEPDDSHNFLFLGQNNTLYWPANDDTGTMKGFRAYFYIPSGTVINSAPVLRGMQARLVIRETPATPTGVESVTGNQSPVTVQKVLRDGQLIIIRNGVEYNINGIILK